MPCDSVLTIPFPTVANAKSLKATLPSQSAASQQFHEAIVSEFEKKHRLQGGTKQEFFNRRARRKNQRKKKKAQDVEDRLAKKQTRLIKKRRNRNLDRKLWESKKAKAKAKAARRKARS